MSAALVSLLDRLMSHETQKVPTCGALTHTNPHKCFAGTLRPLRTPPHHTQTHLLKHTEQSVNPPVCAVIAMEKFALPD